MLVRNIASAAAALALIVNPLRAAAAPNPDVNAVVSQLTARMDAVSAYKARIHLAVHLHSFPYLAANLEGTTSYSRPGHYSVTFDSLPSLASAFQKVSGDVGDPAAWNAKYAIAVDPSQQTSAPNTLALRLTEKTKGQVDHALAYVDLNAGTVTRMEWYYVNGGRIAMDQHFAPVDGVLLVDTQAAEIDMPGYRATASAVFDGYNIQVSMNAGARAHGNH